MSAEQPITLSVGEEHDLELDENPTTGYRWAVTKVSSDAVDVRCAEFRPGRGGIGGGGTRILRLTGRRAGIAEVSLELRRAWSGEALESLILRVDVSAEPSA